jgi:hypothetical protein
MPEPAIKRSAAHKLPPYLRLQPVTSVAGGEPSTGGPAGLIREGEYWTIVFAGAQLRLRHSKGVGYLAELLSRPGTEIDVLTLARMLSPTRVACVDAGDVALDSAGEADLGPILDADAKRAYQQRLEELREEIDRAQRFNDSGRLVRARLESEAIAGELAGATGLGGRDRHAGSPVERARLNTTRAIKAAIARIAALDATLGEHLSMCVHTGRWCVYRPDRPAELSWEVRTRISPRRHTYHTPASRIRNPRRAPTRVSYRVLGEWAVSDGVRTSLD